MPGHPGPTFGRPECKLVPGIYVFIAKKGVDGRDKPAMTMFASTHVERL